MAVLPHVWSQRASRGSGQADDVYVALEKQTALGDITLVCNEPMWKKGLTDQLPSPIHCAKFSVCPSSLPCMHEPIFPPTQWTSLDGYIKHTYCPNVHTEARCSRLLHFDGTFWQQRSSKSGKQKKKGTIEDLCVGTVALLPPISSVSICRVASADAWLAGGFPCRRSVTRGTRVRVSCDTRQ